MRKFPVRISLGKAERRAVCRVMDRAIRKGNVYLERYAGLEVDAYEKEFAAYFDSKFATAVSSGTAAIHTALAALELEPGTEVIVPPITDPGTIAPVLMQQCIPVFADVQDNTLNISAKSIERRITRHTGAVIVVHLVGHPADMEAIMPICRRHRLKVIEDCAQAPGARLNGKLIGTFGDMAAFSLMCIKHMTSGGQGGMVVTDSEEYYWRAKRFADRGKPFNSEESANVRLGLNYRMTDLEAAIGRVQLKRLAGMIAKRERIVQALEKGTRNLQAFRFRKTIPGAKSAHWFVFVYYDASKMKISKEKCVTALNKEGIPAGAYYVELIYDQPWIKHRRTFGNSQLPWSLMKRTEKIDYTGCCPNAEGALRDTIRILIHEGWTNREVKATIAALEKMERLYGKEDVQCG